MQSRRILPLVLLPWVLLWAGQNAAGASFASFTQIRRDSKPQYTRFVAEFDAPLKAPVDHNEVFEYSRFWVDIPGVAKGAKDGATTLDDPLVRSVEAKYYGNLKVQRFLFVLKRKASYEIKVLDKPSRIVIDVLRDGKVFPDEGVAAARLPSATAPTAVTPLRATPAPTQSSVRPAGIIPSNRLSSAAPISSGQKMIVIDPGHGGESMGAVSRAIKGIGTVKEKDVVLRVALELERLVLQSSNMACCLTRRSDTYVSLADRREFTKKRNGVVFVSLHCNSCPNRLVSAQGIEFYYVSPKGKTTASDRMALEAMENDEGVVAVKKSPKGASDLENLFKGLSESRMAYTASESQKLCEIVNKHFRGYNYSGFQRYDRGVKEGNLDVLRQGVPQASMLMEIGFLSNPSEAAMLADPQFEKVVARLLFNALNEYLAGVDPAFKPVRVALK